MMIQTQVGLRWKSTTVQQFDKIPLVVREYWETVFCTVFSGTANTIELLIIIGGITVICYVKVSSLVFIY